jgi:Prokaryotic E2 family A
MSNQWHEVPGETSAPSKLEIPKALEFHRAVAAHPYARFLEFRKSDPSEIIVFEVDVEVPQRPFFAIHQTERLAAVFTPNDNNFPDVISLRTDFPSIPHLNMRPAGQPRSLCLYEQPYPEIKMKWTGFRFLERIRNSLAGSAKGELHAPDQPLEPLVAPSAYVLAICNEFLEAPGGTIDFFHVVMCEAGVQKPLSRPEDLVCRAIASPSCSKESSSSIMALLQRHRPT